MQAGTQFLQVFLGLGFVVLLILALAFLLRRLKVLPGQGGAIKVIGGISLGAKERLILIQVGEEQLLLSAGGGLVRKVHKLEKPLAAGELSPPPAGRGKGFSELLNAAITGRRP